MSTTAQNFRVHAPDYIAKADEQGAVIIGHGQIAIGLTIAQARELGLALERVANEAEAKLPK